MFIRLLTLSLVFVSSVSRAAALEHPTVLTSLKPIALIVEEIVGTDALVKTIISSGVDPHFYELTPEGMKNISAAEVLVLNGAGLEHWMPRDIDTSKIFEIASSQSDPDTHAWLDPKMIRDKALPLAHFLCKILNSDCNLYSARAQKLILSIDTFLSECNDNSRSLLSRHFIGTHRAWEAVAKQCGLEQKGVVKEGEKRFIGTRDFAHVVDLVTKNSISVLVVDTTTDPALVRSLKSDLMLNAVVLDEMASSSNSIISFYRDAYDNLNKTLRAGKNL